MEIINKIQQEGTADRSLLHTLSSTAAQLIPVNRHCEHLPIKPSLVIILELAAQLDLFSQDAQNVVVYRLVLVFVAVFSQAVAILKAISTIVEAIYARAQSVFFSLKVPGTRIKIC